MTSESKIISTDLEFLPCPFCGSRPEVIRKIVSKGSNVTGNLPKGAVMYEKGTSWNGKIRYKWQKYGYVIKCSTKGCPCRAINTKYEELEQLQSAWNKRV